jgi:hypothetical protein
MDAKCSLCSSTDKRILRLTECGHWHCENCIQTSVKIGNMNCSVCNAYDAVDDLHDDMTFFRFVMPPPVKKNNI